MPASLTKYLAIAAILNLVFIGLGCEKSSTNPPEAVTLEWQTTLPNLLVRSTSYSPVRVSIRGVDPLEVDSVKASITNEVAQFVGEFYLYDDAGYFAHDETPDTAFCEAYSGDLSANNGVYSRMVNAGFAGSAEGHYFLQATAWLDGGTVSTSEDTVVVAESAPPELSGLILPDTLHSGFPPQLVSLQVIDPDDPKVDSVVVVYMKLYSPEEVNLDSLPLERTGSGYYSLELEASFAVARASGDYTFVFRAVDTFNTFSDSLKKSVFMENLSPVLSEPTLPDTVLLPSPGDTTYFPISVKCRDDQTVEDMVGVTIQALKPDSTWGSVIDLFDDGDLAAHGDSSAGDSVYTRIVSIWPSNALGLYQFYFRGEDKAGNSSEIIDSLWVVP